ncbi:MAG: hypothetical protein QF662_06295 [Phycisphaerae bacterium]|nr:hypothetical protein [Phycisphaerae bacterium]
MGDGTAKVEDAVRQTKRSAWWLLPLVWCLWLLACIVPALVLEPYLDGASRLASADLALVTVVIAACFFLFTAWPFWIVFRAGGASAAEQPHSSHCSAAGVGLSALELVMLLALAVPFLVAAEAVAEAGVANVAASLAFLAGVGVFGIGIRMLWQRFAPSTGRWLLTVLFAVTAVPLVLDYLFHEIFGIALSVATSVGPLGRAYLCASDGFPDSLWVSLLHLGIYPAVGVIHILAMVLWPRRKRGAEDVVV